MFKLIFTGKLGNDPQMKTANDGKTTFVTFSVAVDSGYGENKRTTWIECSANNKTGAAILQFANKGTKVLVEALPSSRAYTNKQGEMTSQLRALVQNIEFLSYKPSTDQDGAQANAQGSAQAPGPLSGDDIPF